MKKTVIAILSLAIMCFVIYACQKESRTVAEKVNVEKQEKELAKVPTNSSSKLGWLPEGTLTKTTDGGMEVIPPKGWAYAGYNNQNGFFNLESGATKTISCTCNVKGDCRPFAAKGPKGDKTGGCFGNCTDCTMKQSGVSQGKVFGIASGGYYSQALPTRLLRNGETVPGVFAALLEVKEFQQEFTSFIKKAYNGKTMQKPIHHDDGTITAPMGYSLVAISIMGRGMAVVLPDGYVAAELGTPTSSAASCSCAGAGSCKVESFSILGVGSTWCTTINCNTCALTISSLSPRLDNYTVHLNSYAF